MKRFLLVVLVVLFVAVASVFADSSIGQAADALGIKLPAWIQALLGIGGTAATGGAAVWAVISKKLKKAILLYEDCKLVISEIIDVSNFVKAEIKSDEARKEWNEMIDACAKIMVDTGNKSLIQKANTLLTKRVTSNVPEPPKP